MTRFILAHDSTCRQKGSWAHHPEAQRAERAGPGQGDTGPPFSTWKGSRARHPTACRTERAGPGQGDTGPPSSAQGKRQSSWKVLPAPPGREAPVSPGAEGPRHTNLSD